MLQSLPTTHLPSLLPHELPSSDSGIPFTLPTASVSLQL